MPDDPVPDCRGGGGPLAGRRHGPGRSDRIKRAASARMEKTARRRAVGIRRAKRFLNSTQRRGSMTAPRDTFGRPVRRRYRHGHRHLARRRQGRITGPETDRGRIRNPDRHALSDRRAEVDDGRNGRFCNRRALRTSTALTERLADIATEEAIAQSGIGSKGEFSRAAVPRGGAGRGPNGRSGSTIGRAVRQAGPHSIDGDVLRDQWRRKVRRHYHHRFMFGSVARSPCGEPSAPRDRRFRFRLPVRQAPPRSSSASKPFAAARPMQRCVSEPMAPSIRKTLMQVFAAIGAVDPERSPPQGRFQAVLQEPRRIRDRGGRGRAGAGKLRGRRSRAARQFSGSWPAAAN